MILALKIFFILNAFGYTETQIYCNILGEENQSELRINMGPLSPTELALRSPGDSNYRIQNMNIQNIFGSFEEEKHSFQAQPNITTEMIDWSQISNCYVRAGTQWYFTFDYFQGLFSMQLAPFFVKKDPKDRTCITPRAIPRNQRLICN